jgi:hypothetical protein
LTRTTAATPGAFRLLADMAYSHRSTRAHLRANKITQPIPNAAT